MQKALERYLLPDARQMVHELTEAMGPGFRRLNDAVSSLPKIDSCLTCSCQCLLLPQHFQPGLFPAGLEMVGWLFSLALHMSKLLALCWCGLHLYPAETRPLASFLCSVVLRYVPSPCMAKQAILYRG